MVALILILISLSISGRIAAESDLLAGQVAQEYLQADDVYIARSHAHIQAIYNFEGYKIEILLQKSSPIEIICESGFKFLGVQSEQIRIWGAYVVQGRLNGVKPRDHVVYKLLRPIDRDQVIRDLDRYAAVFCKKDVNR